MQDYQFMWANTQAFMSLFRAMKPVLCKVHGVALAGGSDIALCADVTVMGDTAQIGYMPTRVWGCPTTAMWVHRIGPEQAKRMMFTGDKISGVEAARIGLVLKSVPDDDLDDEVEALANRMASVPINQLAMQKLVINSAVEAQINQTQRLATVFDGMARHSPEGMTFRSRVEEVGWKGKWKRLGGRASGRGWVEGQVEEVGWKSKWKRLGGRASGRGWAEEQVEELG